MSISTKNDGAHAAMIEPPPDVRRMLKKTARLVSERGLEMESRVMDYNKNDERYNFLKSSDPYHAFYQHKLTQYRNNPEDAAQETLNPDAPPPQCEPKVPPTFMEPLAYPFEPYEFSFKPPQGITLKERAIMMLAAQFVARYDMYFLSKLIEKVMTNPLFEFIKVDDPRFNYFSRLAGAYSRVLVEIKRGACMAETLVKVFFEQLQILLKKQEQGLDMGHMAMGDLDVVEACVVDYFTHLEEEDKESCTNVPAPRLHPLMGMIMQSRAPVTEIQLIAQGLYNLMDSDIHFQGSSRTSVSVPDVDDDVCAALSL